MKQRSKYRVANRQTVRRHKIMRCKYCDNLIKWKDEGKWIPYSMDGTRHNCRGKE